MTAGFYQITTKHESPISANKTDNLFHLSPADLPLHLRSLKTSAAKLACFKDADDIRSWEHWIEREYIADRMKFSIADPTIASEADRLVCHWSKGYQNQEGWLGRAW